MGLFTPKWMSNDLSKALKAVEKITDPQKLAEVAVNAKLQQVTGKAVECIHDESVLAGIALGDANDFPIEKALEIIEEGAGTQFDPKCVEVFMESLDKVKEVLNKYQD